MTDFSPKNITFFAVQTFWAVPDTLQCYQLDPRTSADPGGCLTQKIGVELSRGLEPLCRGCFSQMKLEQKKQENFHKEENWKKYQHPVLTDYLSILLGTQANSSHINTSIVHEETDRGPKCRGIILISTT